MFFADEIRPTKGIAPRRTSVAKQELAMALDLVERFRSAFEPKKYEDTYREALLDVIDRKRKGKDVHVEPEGEEQERPADLLEALRASVEAHGQRGRRRRNGRNGNLGALSRDELERRARSAGIRGRSKMTKRELAKALERS
jgi:DNA end-binding protein Ku